MERPENTGQREFTSYLIFSLLAYGSVLTLFKKKNFVSHCCSTQARIWSDVIRLYQQKRRQFLIASDVS